MHVDWNPWHGCCKKSEGCLHCFVYRIDSRYQKDASKVSINKTFDLPIRKKKDGSYKYPSKTFFYTSFSSDLLLEQMFEYSKKCFLMMKERSDCHFLFLTKRIENLKFILPNDWNDGYDNVTIGCTCENQRRFDERMPIFLSLPIKHRIVICEPLLENIDFRNYLSKEIEEVVVGGESGLKARCCNYDWILKIRRHCIENNVTFVFRQTGAFFIKDNKRYHIRKKDQSIQARKANINFNSKK